jgi:hypothetical protein
VGSADGIIMATIIASHISTKLRADVSQVWPRIRIHIIDIVQPPGISISQHIDRQKYTVAKTPAANAKTHIAINAAGSEFSVLPVEYSRSSAVCGAAFKRNTL